MGYEHPYPEFGVLGIVGIPRYHSIDKLIERLSSEEVVFEVLDEV